MNDKTRMVTLHKHDTGYGIVWQVELDGVNTFVGLTQEFMNDEMAAHSANTLDVVVDILVEGLTEENYHLTDKEKNNLNKLLQCMT